MEKEECPSHGRKKRKMPNGGVHNKHSEGFEVVPVWWNHAGRTNSWIDGRCLAGANVIMDATQTDGSGSLWDLSLLAHVNNTDGRFDFAVLEMDRPTPHLHIRFLFSSSVAPTINIGTISQCLLKRFNFNLNTILFKRVNNELIT